MKPTDSLFAEVDWDGRAQRIEYRWVGAQNVEAPLLVFLHEGLGSVALWRDFPRLLCDAGGFRGLVWSRPAYGRSTPRLHDTKWGVDFMHRQALEVMPKFLEALGLQGEKPWLIGHSDGGSISLIHAAHHRNVAGVVVMAPHIFVEDLSVNSIAKTRETYLDTDLRAKLGKYHEDVDSAFWGWNDIWLNPAFRAWNIEALLPNILCPVLAIQGENDEYGTMAQIDGIQKALKGTRLLKLPRCGHSPHKDQPGPVIDAISTFVRDVASGHST